MSDLKLKRSYGVKPVLYPEPVLLVSSYDAQGVPNIMTASWGGICCSKPVCVSVSIRPACHTHDAILSRKAFTLGIASEHIAAQADYVGMVSGKKFDKFKISGLTPVRSDLVDAPYAAECPVIIECELTHSMSLGLHTMMIGEVKDVKIDEDCFDAGSTIPKLDKIAPILSDGENNQYHLIGKSVGKMFSLGKSLIRK